MDNYNRSSYPQSNYPYRQPQPSPPPENPHTAVKILLIIAGAVVVIAVMVILALVFLNRNTPAPVPGADQSAAETTGLPTAAKSKMPDLKGLSKEDAISRLAAMGVTVSEIKETETGSAKPGFVFDQVPQKDNDVAPGDPVTLYVARQQQTTAPATALTTAPPATAAPTQAPTKRLYCTASDFVSLRTGKSADYRELAKIPRGAEMLLLNGSEAWYYVRYNGVDGYVYSAYVSEDPPSAQPQTNAAATLYCTAATYVSLRTGKGTDYAELARIPSRAGMEYLYQSGDWYYVRYNGKEGYVYGAYVSADPNAPLNYSGSDY